MCIRQGKGYLQVTDVLVDFNNGKRVFRTEVTPNIADAQGVGEFAVYYTEEAMTDVEYAAAQQALKAENDQRKAGKDADKAAKAERKTAAKAAPPIVWY